MKWTGSRIRKALQYRIEKCIRRSLHIGLSPVPLWAWQKLDRHKLYGIFYHLVSSVRLPHVVTYAYKNPVHFRSDMLYLKENFHLPNYEELRSHLLVGHTFERPSAFVSFDDGMRECIEVAVPILKELEIPAIFFINPGFIDNKKLFYRHKASLCMDKLKEISNQQLLGFLGEVNQLFKLQLQSGQQLWNLMYEFSFRDEAKIEQICQIMQVDWQDFLKKQRPYLTTTEVLAIEQMGFVVGAHTRDHKLLSLLDSEEQISEEIIHSCEDIKKLTGRVHVPFAFPFNGRGIRPGLIQEILEKNEIVDLIFEATGLAMRAPRIVNRLWGDPPPDLQTDQGTNLPRLIAQEYVKQIY